MTIAATIFVALGVALNLVGALGAWAMRDPYQRLHYLAPPASLAPACLTIALFFGVTDKQPGVKMLLITALLNAVNGVVTHATARAQRVRQQQPWGSLTDEERAQQQQAEGA